MNLGSSHEARQSPWKIRTRLNQTDRQTAPAQAHCWRSPEHWFLISGGVVGHTGVLSPRGQISSSRANLKSLSSDSSSEPPVLVQHSTAALIQPMLQPYPLRGGCCLSQRRHHAGGNLVFFVRPPFAAGHGDPRGDDSRLGGLWLAFRLQRSVAERALSQADPMKGSGAKGKWGRCCICSLFYLIPPPEEYDAPAAGGMKPSEWTLSEAGRVTRASGP